MRRTSISLATFALALLAASHVAAQSPTPADIRAKMDRYVGTWDFEEQTRATPGAPEKTATGSWEARWVFDNLIEWSGSSTTDGHTITLIEFEGYDALQQTYTYWFDSDGGRGHAYDGEWDGNTLRIQFVDNDADGSRSRGRCTWPYNADFTEASNYFCEKLTDGEWWVFRRGTARKR